MFTKEKLPALAAYGIRYGGKKIIHPKDPCKTEYTYLELMELFAASAASQEEAQIFWDEAVETVTEVEHMLLAAKPKSKAARMGTNTPNMPPWSKREIRFLTIGWKAEMKSGDLHFQELNEEWYLQLDEEKKKPRKTELRKAIRKNRETLPDGNTRCNEPLRNRYRR